MSETPLDEAQIDAEYRVAARIRAQDGLRRALHLATSDGVSREEIAAVIVEAQPEASEILRIQGLSPMNRRLWSARAKATQLISEPVRGFAWVRSQLRAQQELPELRAQLATQQAEHAKHLARIGVRATELAEENDLCDAVTDALDELDIPKPSNHYSFRVVIELDVQAREHTSNRFAVELDSVYQSLMTSTEEEFHFELDEDWDDVQMREARITVTDFASLDF